MHITLWNFSLLPALIYAPSLFLIVFLATIKLKTKKKQRFYIVSVLTGFIGFAMTFVLPFYEPLRFTYTLVPITFYGLSFIGIVGCLLTNTNPLDAQTPLFAPKPPKKNSIKNNAEVELEHDESKEKPFIQSMTEATKLMDLLLFKLGQPHHYFKHVNMPINEETMVDIPFVLTSPNGIFLIYPCNWSGEIIFSDHQAKKSLSTPTDGEDHTTTALFRETFFKKLLDTMGLQKIPVKTIICATNPSAIVSGSPTKYIATELGELASILKKPLPNGQVISTANLFDIQNAIEINQIKK